MTHVLNSLIRTSINETMPNNHPNKHSVADKQQERWERLHNKVLQQPLAHNKTLQLRQGCNQEKTKPLYFTKTRFRPGNTGFLLKANPSHF